jgi:hypothetical protein
MYGAASNGNSTGQKGRGLTKINIQRQRAVVCKGMWFGLHDNVGNDRYFAHLRHCSESNKGDTKILAHSTNPIDSRFAFKRSHIFLS